MTIWDKGDTDMLGLFRRIRDHAIRGWLVHIKRQDARLDGVAETVSRLDATLAEVERHRRDIQKWIDGSEVVHNALRQRLLHHDEHFNASTQRAEAVVDHARELELRLADCEARISFLEQRGGWPRDHSGSAPEAADVRHELMQLRSYLLGGNYSIRIAGDINHLQGALRQSQVRLPSHRAGHGATRQVKGTSASARLPSPSISANHRCTVNTVA
jgi:hypothetical protein